MRGSYVLRESKIFDPRDPSTAAHGSDLLDASVAKRGEEWWMVLAGQAGGSGATDLYSAMLPKGAPLSATGWKPLRDAVGRLAPLSARQRSAPWDGGGGRHCPSYVKGWDPERNVWVPATSAVTVGLGHQFDVSPFIARRGLDTPPRSCTLSADTPMSRSSARNPLPRDRGQLHIEDTSERTPANHRSRPVSGPNSRRNHGRHACNRAAHMRGTFGCRPSLLPASRAASGRDANRITERIVVWMSWATLLFVTARLTQESAIS